MSTSVPPLTDFLAEIPEFRKAHGKRYALLALLLYVCVAMLCGRRSQAASAGWGKDYANRQSIVCLRAFAVSKSNTRSAIGRWRCCITLHRVKNWKQLQLMARPCAAVPNTVQKNRIS